MSQPWQNIVTFEPDKRGDKPCIRGMRITVHDVLSYLAAGMSWDEILSDFPAKSNLASTGKLHDRSRREAALRSEYSAIEAFEQDPNAGTLMIR